MAGYVFTLAGSIISWKASLQYSVALPNTEVEYMALTEAAKEGIWLKGMISNVRLHQDKAIVFCGSESAIYLSRIRSFMTRGNTSM